MPSLPFSASSSPVSSPSSSPAPSIVLHPASGASARKPIHTSKEDAADAYRNRYAQYLACTFNISMQAALAEADNLLAPQRRSSSVSEAESLREI
ncbi:uncharacterized protein EKO05_0010144 [Ascochyta rabiei]|uniref:Uncharacterized protein n=1 Tax=Didymella rabiei TaxID=5454 RepID=A0A163MF33_DIDRA|nr:uncharacterized protein EKO05_0010144 [Ascochyta rabiei]KZM28657.1 hypothetical protein ST47_g204 [Ascochyta rabiei]UPX19894.1 hypothetical protein EKO05_0010144 [Ascochyta rabiei]